MNWTLSLFITLTLTLRWLETATKLALTGAADQSAISGTWSGSWTSKGGLTDAVTVELKLDDHGKLTGRFRTPVPMEFTEASFNPKTRIVTCEAMDEKTGKHYGLEGKLQGTEITGTLGVNDTKGEVRLIKWTFFGQVIPTQIIRRRTSEFLNYFGIQVCAPLSLGREML
jgi:hypothetical protein